MYQYLLKYNRITCFTNRIKFTLIELMIVISIIAILASMLLPALKKAKVSAFDISCKSNLKQLAIAFVSYNSDYNGYYPTSAPWQTPWHLFLYEGDYIPKPKLNRATILKCPYAKNGGNLWAKKNDVDYFTYGMNVDHNNVAPYPTWRFNGKGYSSTGITKWESTPPEKFIVIADSFETSTDNNQYYLIGFGAGWKISTRHNRRANVLFGDGHATGNDRNQLIGLSWSDNYIYFTEY